MPAGAAPAPPAAAPAQPPAPTPGSTYAPVAPGQSFGYGNPQSPNGTIGGGNATESSAHPLTGEEEDSFDLGARGRGDIASHGDENGPIFVGGPHGEAIGGMTFRGEVPPTYLVRRGDTLWALCGYYFQNPYEWPRIWSYNPQIKNPNWIYPGDEVRLRQGGGAGTAAGAGLTSGTNLVDRRRQVPVDTVFLRDEGWIRDSSDEVWGDVTGSPRDKMFLTELDEVYVHVDAGHDVHLGQELTVFRPLHVTSVGTIVQIGGTLRIDEWNAQDRIARGQLVESLNVVERGAKVGPLARRFEIVAPRRNDVEVQARVLASLHPNVFWGQEQIVFVDKGEKAGLVPGNRLFLVRRGDAWRKTLVTPTAGYRLSPDDEKPLPDMEKTPGARQDEKSYPDEVVGELRVVAVRADTATCLVTKSRIEIEPNELAVARKGY